MKKILSSSIMLLATVLMYGQTYSVQSISYSPYSYTTGTQVLANMDDLWSGTISLGFPFCFYGQSYSYLLIGANGQLSFDTINRSLGDSYKIAAPWPDSVAADMHNTINPAFKDWYPVGYGKLRYNTYGTAPNRYFVASWDSVPLYGSPLNMPSPFCPGDSSVSTFQAVLFEGINTIEFYIESNSVCPNWNHGNGICGLMDATGSNFTIVAGRNATQWTASNEGWRLTPVTGPCTLPGNHAPIALDDHAHTYLNTPVTINVRANDSDADADNLTIPAIIASPVHGVVTTNNGNIVYSPGLGFSGRDSLFYQICDTNAAQVPAPLCDSAWVTITISSIYAGPDQHINLDSATTMAALGTGTWTTLSAPSQGFAYCVTPSSNTSRVLGFTHAGTYSFVWSNVTERDTMQIVVTSIANHVPYAYYWGYDVCVGQPFYIKRIYDYDRDGDSLSHPTYLYGITNGTLTYSSDSELVYTAASPGVQTLYYRICDTNAYNNPRPLCDTGSVYLRAHICPGNDQCIAPTNIGTLPVPTGACPNLHGTPASLTGQTNVNALPTPLWAFGASPPCYQSTFQSGDLPADVWYKYKATGRMVTIKVSASTIAHPQITLYSGVCGDLHNIGCIYGTGDSVKFTTSQSIDSIYYIQISGRDSADQGTFNLSVFNDGICNLCMITSSLSTTPQPVSGTYSAGQPVTFCYTVTSWNSMNSNWMHGFYPTFGSGWDTTTLVPGIPPASCDTFGHWGWYTGDTSAATGSIFPAGFYYNSSNRDVSGSTSPGHSFGDTDTGNCARQFCFTISARPNAAIGSDLSVAFHTTGDGQSGAWTSVGCSLDTPVVFHATSNCAGCVWPGDADANLLVDNNDLLPIGLGYDSTGPARQAVSIVWQGDFANDWAHAFTIYAPTVNFKHADCNGDGVINAHDTTAIMQNYGLIHTKTNGNSAPWRTGLAVLYPVINRDTVTHGDTLLIDVNLGDASSRAANIYGIAFSLNYDPIVIDTTKTTVTFGTSWLGDSTDKINIYKDLKSQGNVKAALTRIDHTTRSGLGRILRFRAIVTTDNIDGKDMSYYTFRCNISDVTAVDSAGNLIALNEGTDSAQVGYIPTGMTDIESLNGQISLYPNPTNGIITISGSKVHIEAASIVNVLGETVRAYSFAGHGNEHRLDLHDLSSGIYYISVKTKAGTVIKKVLVSN